MFLFFQNSSVENFLLNISETVKKKRAEKKTEEKEGAKEGKKQKQIGKSEEGTIEGEKVRRDEE
jgi:hypothetical protein